MRNMYDYAYEYEYQYHPERAGEMFAVVFASLWLAIMIGMLVFMLGSYLLHSFGLYTIAKRMGKKDAWMAFVPFARTYYHGNMAGLIRLKNTTIKNPGLWKLLFPIIYSGAIGIYVLEGNMPVIHAVLSSLVPLYEAICLFIMRKRPFVR